MGSRQNWQIVELELDGPGPGEVMLRMEIAGLCHSDEHLRYSEDARFPIIGGHEGAGVVETVGEGVTDVVPGDHVLCSFIPVCGRCRWCSTGRSYLCDDSPSSTGAMTDGTFRFHRDGLAFGAMDSLGTFSRHTVVSARNCVPFDRTVSFEVAALLSCCVPTGWGAAVRVAEVRPGDVVVVYGSGAVGCNVIQGARLAGASLIEVVDPVVGKHELARAFGATATHADSDGARESIYEATGGLGADSVIVAAGVVTDDVVTAAFETIRKGGTVVLVGAHDVASELSVRLPGTLLTVECKKVVGTLYGNCNPLSDIPMLLGMYQRGELELDALLSARYSLDEIGQGYADMHAGKNLRGVIQHGERS
ncbi:Zn-dependent alcohol dehydrogenase [Amycolatopsis sp. BJA-103]|uniref:Zn-dependent alcohol dehydrogenase n=1 Tax=Amycolatopsis sp. BJA-103 TaxID=1911175 RepID=UPI000CA2854F|nr:Zn-dependent alcohol dehydrogenase [Amycolatopsis sp. BJA-103]AUI60416.1 alcohol dehydrogenase [Amycolatopsis sp. BJA-103]